MSTDSTCNGSVELFRYADGESEEATRRLCLEAFFPEPIQSVQLASFVPGAVVPRAADVVTRVISRPDAAGLPTIDEQLVDNRITPILRRLDSITQQRIGDLLPAISQSLQGLDLPHRISLLESLNHHLGVKFRLDRFRVSLDGDEIRIHRMTRGTNVFDPTPIARHRIEAARPEAPAPAVPPVLPAEVVRAARARVPDAQQARFDALMKLITEGPGLGRLRSGEGPYQAIERRARELQLNMSPREILHLARLVRDSILSPQGVTAQPAQPPAEQQRRHLTTRDNLVIAPEHIATVARGDAYRRPTGAPEAPRAPVIITRQELISGTNIQSGDHVTIRGGDRTYTYLVTRREPAGPFTLTRVDAQGARLGARSAQDVIARDLDGRVDSISRRARARERVRPPRVAAPEPVVPVVGVVADPVGDGVTIPLDERNRRILAMIPHDSSLRHIGSFEDLQGLQHGPNGDTFVFQTGDGRISQLLRLSSDGRIERLDNGRWVAINWDRDPVISEAIRHLRSHSRIVAFIRERRPSSSGFIA